MGYREPIRYEIVCRVPLGGPGTGGFAIPQVIPEGLGLLRGDSGWPRSIDSGLSQGGAEAAIAASSPPWESPLSIERGHPKGSQWGE